MSNSIARICNYNSEKDRDLLLMEVQIHVTKHTYLPNRGLTDPFMHYVLSNKLVFIKTQSLI